MVTIGIIMEKGWDITKIHIHTYYYIVYHMNSTLRRVIK